MMHRGSCWGCTFLRSGALQWRLVVRGDLMQKKADVDQLLPALSNLQDFILNRALMPNGGRLAGLTQTN